MNSLTNQETKKVEGLKHCSGFAS